MPLPSSPWQAAAACAGLPARTVFARRATDAAPALRACELCTVRRQCEETVAPATSWFDGVCAGRLWRNGTPVRLPARTHEPVGRAAAVPAPTGQDPQDATGPGGKVPGATGPTTCPAPIGPAATRPAGNAGVLLAERRSRD
jgi:hypothetical protein